MPSIDPMPIVDWVARGFAPSCKVSTCNKCKASMVWMQTPKGKSMPIQPQTTADDPAWAVHFDICGQAALAISDEQLAHMKAICEQMGVEPSSYQKPSGGAGATVGGSASGSLDIDPGVALNLLKRLCAAAEKIAGIEPPAAPKPMAVPEPIQGTLPLPASTLPPDNDDDIPF